ncbi:DUF4268 domain-containing protein [Phenylobacterium sp.]|uniref:DUF4268 domain-containing protein n=1 Tax=Phenylobacterium sp. TaxID=1871053 RepID=UPI00272FBE44|nr:DUF4268 domain-containing protein [Phenylobacterium sp.]MDP1598725.1 DUF4268 domain-containing protein [Phenylobacterium sp.]
MALFRVAGDALERVHQTTFAKENLLERSDLQRLLKADITALAPDLMVIAEEFGDWEDSHRRIDLLCVDRNAHLVVVELKRTEDGGHMELQAIRYAAMVSSMTVDQLVGVHARFIGGDDAHARAESSIAAFLGWDSVTGGQLADDVRIILAAANFSVELTTAVLWLNKQGLDFTCYRIVPHRLGETVLIDVQQLIPLPEAADYETKLRAQRQESQRVESARGEIFRRFWAQLIERSKARTQVVAGRSTSPDHWLSGPTGRTGFTLTFSMKQHSSRVELYIDFGKGTEAGTLKAFRGLEARKAEIEEAFGEPLIWQDLPESRGCRISYEQPGGWRASEETWPELQERMIEAMVKLEKTIRPELARPAVST